MKPATLPDLKKELKQLDHGQLLQLCLRLGRFKKENKELLTYLLFEAGDEQGYIASIKSEIDESMEELNTSNLYYAKKGLQKINRNLNKYIRYSGKKQTEAELLIHFAKAIKQSPIPLYRSKVISNMYSRLIVKIKKSLSGLHEDLQVDYQQEVRQL
ncbi:MAG: hypothetical protein ACNS60_20310 [Candidatus Cyclobacteriaceae bacterium M2_1C_046]